MSGITNDGLVLFGQIIVAVRHSERARKVIGAWLKSQGRPYSFAITQAQFAEWLSSQFDDIEITTNQLGAIERASKKEGPSVNFQIAIIQSEIIRHADGRPLTHLEYLEILQSKLVPELEGIAGELK